MRHAHLHILPHFGESFPHGGDKMKNRQIPVLMPDNLNTNLISTDPFGSYTGRPKDPEEKPVQDADDL